ncbi:MAG: AAA family ATPase [Nanoarchaeota archaeon]
MEILSKLKSYVDKISKLKKEIQKTVVGQEEVVDSIIKGILCHGNILVEGLPGTAKTLIIRTIAKTTGCSFSRIQFTVDLLPSDIVGITSYNKDKGFYAIKGPIFANFVLADEINRAPPKSQSALLEAMAERQVTLGTSTYKLSEPFFIMATQNPIESSGTYPLPEAQVDRFIFKIYITYPQEEEEMVVLRNNISLGNFDNKGLNKILSPKQVIEMQKYVKDKIKVNEKIEKYIVRIVDATRYPKKYGLKSGKYVEYGVSARGSIGLYISSKADAFMQGKEFVSPQNVKNVCKEVLRHRILLNYEGQAEGLTSDDVIDEILKKVRIP